MDAWREIANIGVRMYGHGRRILDTRGISQSHPRATMIDRQLFVMGSKPEAEWGLDESDTAHQDNLQKDHLASRTPSESRGGNSMPPQRVAQSSKRDPVKPAGYGPGNDPHAMPKAAMCARLAYAANKVVVPWRR